MNIAKLYGLGLFADRQGKFPRQGFEEENPQQNLNQVSTAVSKYISYIVMTVGLTVVIAWIANVPILMSFIPGLPAMKVNTAVGIAILGYLLFRSYEVKVSAKPKSRRTLILLGAIFIILLGGTTLIEYAFKIDFGIDQVLLPDREISQYPGRMSSITAINFVLLGFAILTFNFLFSKIRLWQALLLFAMTFSAAALLGVIYTRGISGNLAPFSTVAIHTSLMMLATSLGFFLLAPTVGITYYFFNPNIVGAVVRRLLPLGIIALSFLGFVFQFIDRIYKFGTDVSVVYMVVMGSVTISALVIWVANKIDDLEGRRKQATELLRESNQSLRQAQEAQIEMSRNLEKQVQQRTKEIELQSTVVKNMDEGVCLVREKDKIIVYANPKFEEIFGFSKDESLGKSASFLVKEAFITLNQSEESMVTKKNGGMIWCKVSTSSFTHPTYGRIFIVITEDITLRKNAELARESAEIKYRSLFEGAYDSILNVDHTGVIQLVNKQVVNTFGYKAEELVGQKIEILIPERYRGGHVKSRDTYMHNPISRPMGAGLELYGLKKDGTEFPVDISLSPVKTPSGLQVTAIIRNITERKSFEKSLSEKAAELARSNSELEQFAYVASHDLHEPLRMITNYSQLLKKKYSGNIDETADKFIGYIVEGVSRMDRLITDLLAYSRVGRSDISIEEVNLNQTLEFVKATLSQSMLETNAKVVATQNLPTLKMNPVLMQQLFQNLISNAIKFHRLGVPPEVEISAQERDGVWTVSVKDNGIGIEPQYANRIFVIFQRLHARTDFPGTGIGLAVCKKIVEYYGGKIWVESKPGEGSIFYFTLKNREG